MAESVIYSVNSNNTVYVDATPVTLSLNINCISASATHTLAIKNGSTTLVTLSLGSYPMGSSTQTVSLTAPQRAAILNSIPNVASFTATYVLSTTLNNVSQGTSSCTGKIAVDPNVSSPDIDAFTYADTNPKTVAFTGDDQCVVPGYSNIVLYSVSATAHNGASIVEYQVTSDIVTDWRRYSQGGTINYGTIPTPTTLNDPTEYSIFVMPIDSRNFATQGYKAIPHVYLYNAPTVIATSLKRNSADPSQIDISFSGTYSNMAQNAVTASYKFKETSASTYGADNAITVTTSGGNFSCSLSGIGAFAETTAYDVVLTIADKITTRTYNFVLAQENPLIAFRDDAVGFGTVPQGTKRVEIAQDWSLVAKGKNNTMAYMPYSWACAAQDSSSGGYIRVCTIVVSMNNVRGPIIFDIQRRSEDVPHRIIVSFAQESNTDPAMGEIYYDGATGIDAFVYKTATSTWDLYVGKNTAYERLTASMHLNAWMQNGITVTHTDAYLSSVPSGAVMATATPLSVYTPTITRVDGNSTVNSSRIRRSGNLCQFTLGLNITGATQNGYNLFAGRFSDAPRPIVYSEGSGYIYGSALMFSVATDMTLEVRNCGAVFSTGTAWVSLFYFTEE